MTDARYVTPEENPERFRLFRLCDCPTCEGKGKEVYDATTLDGEVTVSGRCHDCRGEGRVRQEIAACATPESVGVAIVTLAREGEWDECPLGLLDTTPECETCDGLGHLKFSGYDKRGVAVPVGYDPCPDCKATGVKPTGTWLIRPWLPSARNVTDAARTLAKSKKGTVPQLRTTTTPDILEEA